ncbi:MAG: pyridoxamine 5'-phosphate oxidase family protein [Cyanothece sp. SIO1E1]|nr:pyridoxamine 5'-phosphate oxidase family protein [Cyanothece sp. SIO1E1]
MSELYSDDSRYFQDLFDTRQLANLEQKVIVHDTISEEDKEFIENREFFFMATVDHRGQPQCSYKGGRPGFVKVVDKKTIAFPSYDGNGMFLSMGNIRATRHIGILFIDFENPNRLRLNGTGTIHEEDPLLEHYHEAQLIVRVVVQEIFINCPRYVHRFKRIEQSPYVPEKGMRTPIPEWKRLDIVQDILPERDKQQLVEETKK